MSLSIVAFSQLKIDSGLVAHYNFNKNTDNQASAHSNGTKTGGVYVSGRTSSDSSAIDFDGANDYVDVAIDSFLLTEFTYSLWTKTDGFPSNGDCSTMINVGGFGGDQGIRNIVFI